MSNCLAELRRSRGMTQAELAEQLGITRTHLSRIENGLHRAGGWLVIEISRIFGVPAAEIFFYTELNEPKLHVI